MGTIIFFFGLFFFVVFFSLLVLPIIIYEAKTLVRRANYKLISLAMGVLLFLAYFLFFT